MPVEKLRRVIEIVSKHRDEKELTDIASFDRDKIHKQLKYHSEMKKALIELEDALDAWEMLTQ